MIGWLQSIRVRSQVFAALVVVPVVLGLLGMSVVPQVVTVAIADDVDDVTLLMAVRAVRYAVGIVVACGFVTAVGAAALLRSSLRRSVDSIRAATEALASGNFEHRIDTRRSDELGGLARAVDATAVRLGRLEEARRQMLACVSHELRTPLTIARNTAYSLSRKVTEPSQAEAFFMLDEELAHLGTLIGDLIDAASLHAGGVRLACERVDIADVARDTAARFHEEAQARRMELVVDVDPGERRRALAFIDVDRMQQVLGNLVANAVRHGDAGSRVSIIVRAGDRLRGMHEVRVVNRGAAIPDAVCDAIFEPFVQHGDTVGRVGLGLCIARDLAEAHGGSLDLERAHACQVGRVSFVLRLPVAASPVLADVDMVRAAARVRPGFAS